MEQQEKGTLEHNAEYALRSEPNNSIRTCTFKKGRWSCSFSVEMTKCRVHLSDQCNESLFSPPSQSPGTGETVDSNTESVRLKLKRSACHLAGFTVSPFGDSSIDVWKHAWSIIYPEATRLQRRTPQILILLPQK
jgi:hypothetical protein